MSNSQVRLLSSAIALLGGGLMILLGVLNQEQAIQGIDFISSGSALRA